MTTNTTNPKLRLSSPADVLSAVPYLFGFHPADSAVVIGLNGKQVAFQLRADLADAEPDPAVYAEHLAGLVAAQGVSQALVVGYGPMERTEPPLTALGAALRRRDIRVLDLIRADDGRYWSLMCTEEDCCPLAGRPYDTGSTAFAAAAVVAGLVAEPTRADLAKRFEPVSFLAGVAVDRACDRAAARLDAAHQDPEPLRSLRESLTETLTGALAEMTAGALPDDDTCAWLDALVCLIPLRDEAWREIRGDHDTIRTNLELWSHVCRRTGLAFSAAPAALAAYAAWRLGDGALAHTALDRANAVDPDYSLSQLIRQALDGGLKAKDEILDFDSPYEGVQAARPAPKAPAPAARPKPRARKPAKRRKAA